MLSKFFNRSLGEWTSHRSYYYVKKDKLVNSTTNFKWKFVDSQEDEVGSTTAYIVNWDNKVQNSKGEMLIYFDASTNTLFRDSGYFTKNATESKIIVCTENILKTKTEYNNMIFVETIEFLTDILRVRRTVAYTIKENNSIFLIGNYIEHKQKD